MKHLLRIPTNEPYAYIEAEFEGTPDDALDEYKRLTALVKGDTGAGLESAEWRDVLDHYLSGKPFVGDAIMEQIERMSAEQKFCMQEIKKSRARTK